MESLFRKPLKKLLAVCLLLLSAAGMQAQNQQWTVVSSAITFKIKNAGLTVDGSFSGLDAKILFEGDKPSGNRIEATVDVRSIQTGIDARNNHLKKAEYFDAETYPKIKLVASLFSKQGPGKYTGYFTLSIKNVARPVSIPFDFTEAKDSGTFTATFTINRRDYGVGGSSWVMADNVTVSVTVQVKK